jgi:hypothetical protein
VTGAGGADDLWRQMRARVEPERVEWLAGAVEAVRDDAGALAKLFPAVGRHVGREPLEPGDDEYRWTVDDAGRVLLILAAEDPELDELYRYGDAAERRGVLRSLDLLPEPADAGLALVQDAVRTNDPRLLAAALGPYGLTHLDDEAVGQAVLKCVFVGVPLVALAAEPLAARTTPTLSRMLAAYVRERVAAGRDVPPDVWPVIDAHPPADELAAIEAELDHPVPGRRQAAAAALAQRAQLTGGHP